MTVAAVLVLTAIFTSCRKDGTDPASSGSAPRQQNRTDRRNKAGRNLKAKRDLKAGRNDRTAATENWVLATDYEFFDKDGNEVSPAPGGDPWSYFDYWTGWDDTQIYDSHGEGYPDGLNQTDIIRVTPGEHTIKVVAGTPAEEGWNGMCVNVIEYVYDENKPTPPTSDVLLPAVIVCMTAASAAVVLKKKHS